MPPLIGWLKTSFWMQPAAKKRHLCRFFVILCEFAMNILDEATSLISMGAALQFSFHLCSCTLLELKSEWSLGCSKFKGYSLYPNKYSRYLVLVRLKMQWLLGKRREAIIIVGCNSLFGSSFVRSQNGILSSLQAQPQAHLKISSFGSESI